MKSTLVLNSSYQPLGVVPWTRGFILFYSQKAEVLKYYENFELRTPNRQFKCPSVIVLRDFFDYSAKYMKFSKENVFIRDEYTCQYCGKRKKHEELTLDHVVPKSRGGIARWENSVACCKPCNQYKSDLTPEQAGMRLMKKPQKPSWEKTIISKREIPDEWREYLNGKHN